MVELRHLLLGPVLWQLDVRLDHDRDWTELVASDNHHISLSGDILHRHVLQLEVCQCLPHWLSSRWAECFWNVGIVLFRWSPGGARGHLVR